MDVCVCHDALQHSFATVRDAVYGAKDKDVILAGSELIAQSDEKWMRLYRCRICGTLWAEGCYSSGHMDLYYLFPAPPTDDPVCWLREEAAELPRP
jgi:hypothetical protein